ncbi:uncharacterized protein LOC112341589 [Selaginella moellendorffii]|uniref:uncharacterized protein LOC112341589 n=1 Tax=Selaginella moellendorffii TaxID=88036 RepID=UPI000D1CCFE0|nr:uncharacterized protein LOC112341589 [Selaginella moellendorffii]|eukprot:XP_024517741.1 uncharacterized protein LOC112341589 [Selaginella moellendorffii]
MACKLFFFLALLVCGGVVIVNGAECFENPNPGYSVQQYQQAAQRICNGGFSDFSLDLGQLPHSQFRMVIQAHWDGNSRQHCWYAFNNIISQCVQGAGIGFERWALGLGFQRST